MADFVYNGAKYAEMIDRINSSILKKLNSQLETFDQNHQIIKNNWSGDEFNKAEEKLLEIRKTLVRAIDDFTQQANFLKDKKQKFDENHIGY